MTESSRTSAAIASAQTPTLNAELDLGHLVRATNDPMFVQDADLRYLATNPAHSTGLLGESPSRVMNRKLDEYYPARFASESRRLHRALTETNTPAQVEVMLQGRFVRNEVVPFTLSSSQRVLLIRCRFADPVSEARSRASTTHRSNVQLLRPTAASFGPLSILPDDSLHMLRELAGGSEIDTIAAVRNESEREVEQRLVDVSLALGCSSLRSLRVHAYERGLHLFTAEHWFRLVESRR